MNQNKSLSNNELELGKYLEEDMIALTEDDVAGGWTPVLSFISVFVSNQTCPTTACTKSC